jgi:hypothetical protein
MPRIVVALTWIVAGLASISGCGDGIANQVAAKNDSNIKKLVNLYYAFQFTNSWQGPKDEAALRAFAKNGFPAKNLALMGIDPDRLDEILVSDRDGKPFKVRYGIVGAVTAVHPLVFEQDGVEGRKLVGFNGPTIEEVDEARYKELWEKGGLPQGMSRAAQQAPDAKNAVGSSGQAR